MSQSFKEPEHSHLVRFANLVGFTTSQMDFALPDRVPDLIVHTSEGNLGIEHTQLFRIEARQKLVVPQAQEQLRNKMLGHAREIAEARGVPMISLHAYFSHDKVLTARNIGDGAQSLVNLIEHTLGGPAYYANVGNPQEYHLEAWQYKRSFRNLFPIGIDGIMFNIVNSSGSVMWGAMDGGVVPEITTAYIQSKIDGKDAKLERYRLNSQKVWLLMVADNGVMSSYFNITEEVANHVFRSHFDRVFYFERFDDKIVELKIEHSCAD